MYRKRLFEEEDKVIFSFFTDQGWTAFLVLIALFIDQKAFILFCVVNSANIGKTNVNRSNTLGCIKCYAVFSFLIGF